MVNAPEHSNTNTEESHSDSEPQSLFQQETDDDTFASFTAEVVDNSGNIIPRAIRTRTAHGLSLRVCVTGVIETLKWDTQRPVAGQDIIVLVFALRPLQGVDCWFAAYAELHGPKPAALIVLEIGTRTMELTGMMATIPDIDGREISFKYIPELRGKNPRGDIPGHLIGV
jgi:hypothetical protein